MRRIRTQIRDVRDRDLNPDSYKKLMGPQRCPHANPEYHCMFQYDWNDMKYDLLPMKTAWYTVIVMDPNFRKPVE